MTAGYESRRFSRSAVDVPVRLDFGQGKTLSGQIVNVSLIGIYVTAEELMPLGSECEANFAADPMKPIQVRGCVVHEDLDGMGIEIRGIESASLAALRDIIVDNSENAFECENTMLSNMAHMPPLY
jgi:hypothetical protein